MRMHQVVIVGGGFGGLNAAIALRHAPVQITLIDRTNHHLFQPLLYQVATAGLSSADIAAPIRSVLRKQSNTTVVMAEVIGVNKSEHTVLLADDQIRYDTLIIATGSRDSYFGHPEWEDYAPGLKTLPDAIVIRSRILRSFEQAERESDKEVQQSLMTFILVGAGPTGVEMSGAIAELSQYALAQDFRKIDTSMARVVLIEAGPSILSSFPKKLSDAAQSRLENMRVEIMTGTRVEKIDAEGVVANGKRIDSHNVIWTAGVQASPAGVWLDTECDKTGRVIVEKDMSVQGHPEIFVLGDTAAFLQNGKQLPGVAPAAMQQGRYAAKVILNRLISKSPPPPFHYLDKGNLATVGRRFAIVDAFNIRIAGVLAWLMWIVIHILYLIGFRNRFLVMFQWAWAYFTYQRGARVLAQESAGTTAKHNRA